ncbi:MAG: hypothetical protein OXL37_09470 [Chloroflexota bacterium]|nr:hypothetical protein [Chloroflexota bacterium]MDE2960089.1 hypothetical protein [Chloroflexota bacterium]
MQLGLAIAVALLIVGAVAWPFLSGRWRASGSAPNQREADEGATMDNVALASSAALEGVYDAIRTLQMEHSLGRIADDDFREQLDQYRRQAAEIMRDLDREVGGERGG